ncbi:MAG: InlB B-repeat-containing protein [Lachnospiraceae bacterium]|nr:InlB B-repeat-containing protein [Lachnospiraceae bacterium]
MKKNGFLFVLLLAVMAFAGVWAFGTEAHAEGSVAINEESFPDDIFRDFIAQYDTDGDGVLNETELDGVIDIDCSSMNIADLSGIRYFQSLRYLNCSENQLTALDIRENTALRHLDCMNNQIGALDVSQNTALTLLYCNGNQLDALDVSNNTALDTFFCFSNSLKSLDVTRNTALTFLECGENQLTALDVSRNTILRYLCCEENQLTALDVSRNTVLYQLFCPENSLTSLDLSHNSELWDLNCDDNQLTFLDLSANPALYCLSISNNRLTSLDVNNNTLLEYLYCFSNQLTELNISRNPALVCLECGNNQLTSLDIRNSTALEILFCSGNQIPCLDIRTVPAILDTVQNGEKTDCGTYFYYKSQEGEFSVDRSTVLVTSDVTYTVSYDANGGTGTPSSQVKTEDVPLVLSTIRPSRSFTIYYNANEGSVSPASSSVSCVFLNWNTSKDGTGTAYAPGGSYIANEDVTLYAQWENPAAGALAVPVRNGYLFVGWFTSAEDGEQVTGTTMISGSLTVYAHWENIYNLGDETYSFSNYTDSDSDGHCFGMSVTSAAYYNGFLDIGIIGGNANTSLYSLGETERVKRPICYYQKAQGSYSRNAIVAGGSFYKTGIYDVDTDWQAVVDYVKGHDFDHKGMLQLAIRTRTGGGHAINFLRYERVNGEDRIYAYDNNFPTTEVYFYRNSEGYVMEAPVQTFSGAIDCIALRDIRLYFSSVKAFDETHVLYMDKDAATVRGYSYSFMENGASGTDYVMYEIPAGTSQVIIIPSRDYADIIYMDTEYSFGTIADGTYGVLTLSSVDEYGTGGEASFQIYQTAGWQKTDGKWYYYGEDGSLTTGWKKIGGKWYYFDPEGAMQTGWLLDGGKWFYLDAGGSMATGWRRIGSWWYYLDVNGAMATGWKEIAGKWYYFTANGTLAVGWQQINGKWYYMKDNGDMLIGWLQIDSRWYYLKDSGVMATGWQKISDKWYYFNRYGEMGTGWKTIDGNTYFFKASGEMAASEWCQGYWLNSSGTWTYPYKASWKKDDTGWRFADTGGWYAKNTTVRIDGKTYTFDARGYWVE